MKIEEIRYNRLRREIDSYKQHYENLFFLLLSILLAFISLSLFLINQYFEYFEENIPFPLENFLEHFYAIGIVFGIILFVFFIIVLAIIGFLLLIEYFIDSILKGIICYLNKIETTTWDLKIKPILFACPLIVFFIISYLLHPLANLILTGIYILAFLHTFINYNVHRDEEIKIIWKKFLDILTIFFIFTIVFPRYTVFLPMIFFILILITKIVNITYKLIIVNRCMKVISNWEKLGFELDKEISIIPPTYKKLKKVNDKLEKDLNKIRNKRMLLIIPTYNYHPVEKQFDRSKEKLEIGSENKKKVI